MPPGDSRAARHRVPAEQLLCLSSAVASLIPDMDPESRGVPEMVALYCSISHTRGRLERHYISCAQEDEVV